MYKNKLYARLKNFTIDVVTLVKSLPKTEENKIFGKQIIRSASSIGANYYEAVYAQTKQDFIHCMKISRKEAHETVYWLELIIAVNQNKKLTIDPLVDECFQILKILTSSIKTMLKSSND